MQVQIKPLEKSRVHMTVEVPAETVAQWRKKAIQRIAEQVHVPGFRAGKVPEDVLLSQVGEKAVVDETTDLVLQNTYGQAVKEHNLQVVGRPEKVELIMYEPFQYEVIVPVYPEVKLKNYKKLKIPKEKIEISQEELDEVVRDLQKRFAVYEKVDRPAQMKDKVVLDFEGKDEGGVVLDGTRSKNHPVVLGEKYLLEDFEKEVIGMQAGEEKKFELTFPKDYHAKHLSDKKVIFEVKLHGVEQVTLPEINEDFVEKVKGKKVGKEDFLTDIRSDIQTFKEQEQARKRENELLEKLLTMGEMEVPEALINEELDYMTEEFQQRVERQGIPLESFLQRQNETLESLREKWRKDAEDRLAVRFILRAIIDQEKIEVSEEEIQAEIAQTAQRYPESGKGEIEQRYAPGSEARQELTNRIQVRKLMNMLLE